MARPQKQGLDYYPMNTDFLQDIKIKKIMKAGGPQSVAVLICLLGNIYRDCGYYMRWDEDVRFLIADEVGVNESLVREVVNKSIQVSFFDQKMFQKHHVLTSKGIQKRYLEATARRTGVTLKPELDLVSACSNRGFCIQ